MNRAQLKDALDKEGNDGWEFVDIDSIVTGGVTTERNAIFKRQKYAGGTMSTGMSGGGAGMMPAGMGASTGGSGIGYGSATTMPAPGGANLLPGSIPSLPATSGPSGVYSPSGVTTPAPASKLTLHTIPLLAATATNAASVLKELMSIGEFPGVIAIIPDADTNSLIVKASDAGLKAVTEQVKKLEVAAAKKNEEETKGFPKGVRPKP